MNRRDLFIIGAAAAAVATMPSLPAIARQRTFWTPGALLNPHADLVLDFIEEVLNEGRIYAAQDHYIDLVIDLDDPVFHVDAGKPVWNCVRGYRDPEPGLAITLFEASTEVVTFGIGSTSGLDDYGSRFAKKEKDLPRYFVKKPWLPYDESRDVMKALGKKAHLDLRWLEEAVQQMKQVKEVRIATA